MRKGDLICVVATVDEDDTFLGYNGVVTKAYDDGAEVTLFPDDDTPEEILDHLEGLFFEYVELRPAN